MRQPVAWLALHLRCLLLASILIHLDCRGQLVEVTTEGDEARVMGWEGEGRREHLPSTLFTTSCFLKMDRAFELPTNDL